MDTDDLSIEAYEGIILEAEKLSHDLTLHYGLLSSDCKDEAEFIRKSEKLSKQILKAEDWEHDDLFFGNPPTRKEIESACMKILANIEKVKAIPFKNRTFDF